MPKGASVIREVDRLVKRVGEDGHGTQIATTLRRTYKGHDRVVIVSDMQTMPAAVTYANDGAHYGALGAVPANVPMYGFNLGGYKPTIFPSDTNRVELGGLTDATFRMIPLIEAGRNAAWPF